jgi:phage repressor protein C with HTH and peptisase S24 domain
MLKIVKITGESLFPDYQEGDYVIVITIPFLPFKQGDTVVFRHSDYGIMIKKINRVDSDKIHVIGLHPNSVDSRQFGPISRNDIIGKVIFHIRKPVEKKQIG